MNASRMTMVAAYHLKECSHSSSHEMEYYSSMLKGRSSMKMMLAPRQSVRSGKLVASSGSVVLYPSVQIISRHDPAFPAQPSTACIAIPSVHPAPPAPFRDIAQPRFQQLQEQSV